MKISHDIQHPAGITPLLPMIVFREGHSIRISPSPLLPANLQKVKIKVKFTKTLRKISGATNHSSVMRYIRSNITGRETLIKE